MYFQTAQSIESSCQCWWCCLRWCFTVWNVPSTIDRFVKLQTIKRLGKNIIIYIIWFLFSWTHSFPSSRARSTARGAHFQGTRATTLYKRTVMIRFMKIYFNQMFDNFNNKIKFEADNFRCHITLFSNIILFNLRIMLLNSKLHCSTAKNQMSLF